jgi:hypothetical protein
MINPIRLFVIVAGVSALGVAAPAQTTPVGTFEIAIGNGPHAGTYKLSNSDVMCVHLTQLNRVGIVYKDFDAADLTKVGEAEISVSNPDDAAPKQGKVLVAFGARSDKRATRYSLAIPDESTGPLALTRSGKAVNLEFRGKTKDGISLHVTATCTSLEEL